MHPPLPSMGSTMTAASVPACSRIAAAAALASLYSARTVGIGTVAGLAPATGKVSTPPW